MSEFKGKTLMLTGASRGIGRALALQLAEAGVNLVLNARDAALLNDAASGCRNLGMRPIALTGNAALELGHFHGFIRVAGVLHPGPFLWELSEAQFHEIFAASVTASYRMIRCAVPELPPSSTGPVWLTTACSNTGRTSTDAASPELRHTFWGFKERGESLKPEASAKALVTILASNPRRFHGGMATWRDGV